MGTMMMGTVMMGIMINVSAEWCCLLVFISVLLHMSVWWPMFTPVHLIPNI